MVKLSTSSLLKSLQSRKPAEMEPPNPPPKEAPRLLFTQPSIQIEEYKPISSQLPTWFPTHQGYEIKYSTPIGSNTPGTILVRKYNTVVLQIEREKQFLAIAIGTMIKFLVDYDGVVEGLHGGVDAEEVQAFDIETVEGEEKAANAVRYIKCEFLKMRQGL
ncbi:hypothetical protein AJ79_08119 [Helicocarpus griseus UAMH5409]|uniref:Uncharacterized protein n=1 Tax=Helicocarpus griseus UAMH5409 TaxID=1447875 RepID=A0A2B7WVS3_9EURO|nr:hypothetical protein AJ79_08119 [Helicocarpus griseus UAMH5409]